MKKKKESVWYYVNARRNKDLIQVIFSISVRVKDSFRNVNTPHYMYLCHHFDVDSTQTRKKLTTGCEKNRQKQT